MNRFLEYTTNHPFLVAAAAILAVLAIVIEIRQRARGSSRHRARTTPSRLANSGALLLDVRDAQEYEAGHIIDARHVPAAEIASQRRDLKKYKEKPVIVYCESGTASARRRARVARRAASARW